MKISIAGTGYVGLVTGVCLSDVGHDVTCLDIDSEKISKMQQGISPIYEPGLDDLMKKNIQENRLHFTSDIKEAYANANVIFIAVGTPRRKDGSVDLTFIETVAKEIGQSITQNCIVVVKSTVPVGTNDQVLQWINEQKRSDIRVDVISNPEFLREGTAIHDTVHGDRIVIGYHNKEAAEKVAQLYAPFNIPIVYTDIKSAEMIKYAANAFLAMKISFINEIANISELVGANIEDVAKGIGLDKRIGTSFLQAGIGYGGSCFPKDTNALVHIANDVNHRFELLEAVVNVNNRQQIKLFTKAKDMLHTLKNKKVAVLGLAFKPNTDDIREAASIEMIRNLLEEGAVVTAYDPISIANAKKVIGDEITYTTNLDEALVDADCAFILTEWDDVKQFPLQKYVELMRDAIIFDGRNCYDLSDVAKYPLTYISIGRQAVINGQSSKEN